MSIIEYISFNPELDPCKSPCTICLGNFDGVHIGHAALVSKTIEMKKELSATGQDVRSAALCFSTLPVNYFGKNKIKNLISLEDKLEVFRSLGLDGVYVCDFGAICSYSPYDFINKILFSECSAIGAVCGFNYNFGAKAAGNSDTLKEHFLSKGFCFEMVPAVTKFGEVVSSTLIREYIAGGDFEAANEMLGRPFSISHTVVHGKNLGTKLGFPTINHIFDESSNQIIPAFAIYATKTIVDGETFLSVTNVGTRPTVSSSGVITCETHIIDSKGVPNLYGKNVRVKFYKKLRDEVKFSSKEELSAAISKDIENAKAILKA